MIEDAAVAGDEHDVVLGDLLEREPALSGWHRLDCSPHLYVGREALKAPYLFVVADIRGAREISHDELVDILGAPEADAAEAGSDGRTESLRHIGVLGDADQRTHDRRTLLVGKAFGKADAISKAPARIGQLFSQVFTDAQLTHVLLDSSKQAIEYLGSLRRNRVRQLDRVVMWIQTRLTHDEI
jgi:hypothetical protein